MSGYVPPKSNEIYNVNDFKVYDVSLSEKEANKLYLKKQAQGIETFQNVIVNGTTNIIDNFKVNNLTSNSVLITDALYNLASSTITSAELNNLLGCNRNIQNQIDDKPFVYDSDNSGIMIPQPIIVIGLTSTAAAETRTENFFSNTIFSSPPVIIGTCQRNNSDVMIPAIFNITTSSFQHTMKRTNTGGSLGTLHWMAIGY
jgi:hypothetical protein